MSRSPINAAICSSVNTPPTPPPPPAVVALALLRFNEDNEEEAEKVEVEIEPTVSEVGCVDSLPMGST